MYTAKEAILSVVISVTAQEDTILKQATVGWSLDTFLPQGNFTKLTF